MRRLPDLQGLAIFAKVAQLRSFSAAAAELNLSKATVSKTIVRLESRLKLRLLNRTSRQLSLTEAGMELAGRAAVIVAEGEAAEDALLGQAELPQGLIRLAAPMSFGVRHIAPLLPEFLARYPDIAIDLQMSDGTTDLVAEGFDGAVRIAALPDSSLIARALRPMPRFLIGAPSYFKAHDRPTHPRDLAHHQCVVHAPGRQADSWLFTKKGAEPIAIRPAGRLRCNNGDATLPVLRAGLAIGILPEFFVRDDLANGALERVMPDWNLPAGSVFWVTPARGLRPRRVELLAEFLQLKLAASEPDSVEPRATKRAQRAEHES